MAKRLKVIKIDRERWLRGTENGCLRNNYGLQCCLGFVCEAYGVKRFKNSPEMPLDLGKSQQKKLPKWLLQSDEDGEASGDVAEAANQNDNRSIEDEEREARIIDIFARNGLKAKFV